ncbi:SPFH domain-containing protein [Candidatus Contubernalis alkaliaceticus]|uniref:SPFH domain-containing protein n=1 Tax=Candidatus Contubernalis alkaliaceticus TaxID=338645 RepID=UPI001F4BEE8E|nr:SPFH domain-containing protein [Candidatus Contubernalis alkalaceticus]UNC91139.1 SPFH domain-containing protein [Candidatus Contubernalis alkalaceticus]
MAETEKIIQEQTHDQEIEPRAVKGMPVLLGNIIMMILAVIVFIWGIRLTGEGDSVLGVALIIAGTIYFSIVGPIIFIGLKVLKPKEALVLTLFGKYFGTLKGEGFFFVNPFVMSASPAVSTTSSGVLSGEKEMQAASNIVSINKKISLKAMTLNNEKQKINDQLGNPIIIGIVVIWRVVNTVKAVFNVDNYKEFLSIQCDSALRNIVREFPYDTPGEENEMSLRGSSQEVAEKIKVELQDKVEIAGLEILEARITHLAYAPEIAAAMLQRQQASAIIDARQMIVEGAVGMVEMALDKLNQNDVVQLDEERKAAMVSNLLVVLCGNRDAQPVVNSGSLY